MWPFIKPSCGLLFGIGTLLAKVIPCFLLFQFQWNTHIFVKIQSSLADVFLSKHVFRLTVYLFYTLRKTQSFIVRIIFNFGHTFCITCIFFRNGRCAQVLLSIDIILFLWMTECLSSFVMLFEMRDISQ